VPGGPKGEKRIACEASPSSRGRLDYGTRSVRIHWYLGLQRRQTMTRPHDSGSQANETDDGLDATTEALRHAAEDTPAGDGRGKIDKTPVFDRADQAPKI